ncbi:insulinase family protein [Pyxidicoccus parkwayensis]|uniref:Insulinase family protein n=1 Tax=Pyxidicoccus parkwayensis TaxID=2813578 RepID=A0ABX7NRI8_9BACT|nr:pitrilysin family protein [Pyxidicoccus parkwaysis]QSQ21494.1 insulinase family protein [Pyxidicoccus parkwaysis]
MKRRTPPSLLAAVLLAATLGCAQTPAPTALAAPAKSEAKAQALAPAKSEAKAPAPAPVTSVEGITEYQLPNGLRVLLFPDPTKPNVTVNVTYFVGSKHEGYGETGMAHLLEHLMFKGTPTTQNVPQALTERGARPNGTTWMDRTNYYETLPASDDNLRWALGFEADRMVNSFIARKDLDSEMTVVRNEFESGENDPRGILFERVMSASYIWHSYGKATIGARSDLENVPIDRLQDFYRKYYRPDNALLVVAGRFDDAKALSMIQDTFGALKKPATPVPVTYTAEPVQDGEREVTLRRVGDTSILTSLYHVPEGAHPDFAAIDVLTLIMGNNPSGRLYKSLVATKKAARTGASNLQLRDPGVLTFSVEMREDQPVAAAREAFLKTVEDAAKTPFTEEEVNRAKTQLMKSIELTLNNSERAAIQLSEWAATGDWRLFFLHRDRIEAVKPEDVTRVAATYLKPSNRTLGTFVPTAKPDRSEMPPPVDVAKMMDGYKGREAVAQGEVFDPSPANVEARVQRGELPGGVKYALLPKKTRGEMVNVTLNLRWGTEEALRGKTDAAQYAGRMLMRGTTKRGRQQLQDALDKLKARVGVEAGLTGATVSIECPRASLSEALKLMVEVLREPAFDANEFALLKQERLAALESQRSEPETQGSIAFWRAMSAQYPKGHPYYVPTFDERLAGIKDTKLEDARAFHKAYYGASNGELAVVGDFEPKDVVSLAGDLFGGWKSPAPFKRVAQVFTDGGAKLVALETPDKANAYYLAGQSLKLRKDDADWPALMLGNFVLGGGFLNSRLATRIRQQDGLSYGVGSSLDAGDIDAVGNFVTYAIYAPENATRLEAAMREEVTRALQKGFSAEELEKARAGLLEYRQAARSQDGGLARQLAGYLYLGRTLTFDASIEEKLAKLHPEDVRKAMERHLDWAKVLQVRAGDFANAEKKAKASVKAPAAP